MKKSIIILCLFLSKMSFSQYSNYSVVPIENINITLAEEDFAGVFITLTF